MFSFSPTNHYKSCCPNLIAMPGLHFQSSFLRSLKCNAFKIYTGYNQSITGCGSQRKLMLTAWSTFSNWIWLCWETHTLKVVFVEHHTHFNVYVSQRSQIQFEDENHAIYMSFRWVTTTWLHWEPQPVTLWLYPVRYLKHRHKKAFSRKTCASMYKHPSMGGNNTQPNTNHRFLGNVNVPGAFTATERERKWLLLYIDGNC